MTTPTLDRLIAEAQETKDDPKELQRQIEELQTKWLAVSKTYEAHSDELIDLVAPLATFLPSVGEYESYAAPHDDKAAGPHWNTERFYTPAARQLRIKNPGLVVVTQCKRSTDEPGDAISELSDEEFEDYMDNVDAMACWWEKQSSATPLDLAKSIIVHTVLLNPALRDAILQEARESICALTLLNARLSTWQEDQ